jgi:hypothetical protein
VQSRESILIATILQQAWQAGQDMQLEDLVRAVQTPPFERLGVLDIETFFPSKERSKLALSLNSILASPSFAAWLEGDALDAGKLLWTAEGKPRVSVISIAHLSDRERVFFVSLLLAEIVSWMRTQSGTSNLRALFYMDEVFVEPAGRPRNIANERPGKLARELDYRAGGPGGVAEELAAPEQIEDLRGLRGRDRQTRPDEIAAHLQRADQDVLAPRFRRRLARHEELLQRETEPLAVGAAHLPGHLIEQVGRGAGRRGLSGPEHRERGGKVQRAELVDQPLAPDPVDRGVPEPFESLHARSPAAEDAGGPSPASNDLCPYWVPHGASSWSRARKASTAGRQARTSPGSRMWPS